MSERAVFVLDTVGTWVHDAIGADLPANILPGLSKIFVQIAEWSGEGTRFLW